jgi:hypothetical protein
MSASNEAHAHIALERTAKTAAAAIALTYSLGLIVSNVFLGELGTNDFDVLRARLVLVGMNFCLYLALPTSIAILPAVITQVLRHSSASPARRHVDAVLGTMVAVIIFPAPFDPFVWGVPHYSSAWFWIRFWNEVYGGYWQWPYIALLIATPVIILARAALSQTRVSSTVRAILIVLIVAGVISQVIPFALNVYPVIDASVGGGQPRVIRAFFKPEFHQAINGTLPNGNYYLLWHTTSESLVLSGANEGPIDRTYIVRPENMMSMIVYDAHVRSRGGDVESVVLHGRLTCDYPLHLPRLPD